MPEPRLKIAVFIDFDNIEIGVKTTLNAMFDVGAVLEAIKERGEVVTKVAYGDWKRAGDHSRLLAQHAIRLVQRNVTPGGDKNGADINLALDALEMALTHQHINAFVIVGGDSDFITLVEKLKQYDKTVFVVGGRAFTSAIMQKNCHEFIAYENVIAPQGGRRTQERGRSVAAPTPLKQAFPLVQRALKVLSEREVSPQLGLLKSTLLQLDSAFSERDYGSSSFRDFMEKLAQAGLVKLNQSGRSLLVELKNGDGATVEEEAAAPAAEAMPPAPTPPPAEQQAPTPQPAAPALQPEIVRAGEPGDAIRVVWRLLETAPAPLRWPMYVRNVKQFLRASDQTFDERRYGFAGILDLLRGCQREGVLRLERDRRGGLRVFPGVMLQRGTPPLAEPPAEAAVTAQEPGMVTEVAAVVEAEIVASVVEGAEAAVTVEAAEIEAPAAEVEEAAVVPEPEPAAEKPKRRRRAAAGGAPKTAPAARKPRTAGPRARKA